MLLYLFITCIICMLIVVAYLKIKYGFWVSQPVFHVYDFFYMIRPPGIINHHLPDKNKYTNFNNIKTYTYDELSKLKQDKFIHFVQRNYLRNKDNIYAPTLENVAPYFAGLDAKLPPY